MSLAQGTVRVTKQGRLLSLLHRGDCFGEMAHILERDFKRSTDVIAKNDVVLIEINPDVLIHATIRMPVAVRRCLFAHAGEAFVGCEYTYLAFVGGS